MLKRLDGDVRYYAAQYATKGEGQTVLQLAGLLPADIRAIVQEARAGRGRTATVGALSKLGQQLNLRGSRIDTALAKLGQLSEKLRGLREEDGQAVQQGLYEVDQMANRADSREGAPSRLDLMHMLRRLCGQEAVVTFPLLTGQLLSSRGEHDLCDLCPHLSRNRVAELMQLAAATLLRSARFAYITGCCAQASGLQAELSGLRSSMASLDEMDLMAASMELSVKAATLASALSVRRYTLRPGSEAAGAAAGCVYDPRFVVFEFTANILLRQEQEC
jgi:hypothetical protein